MAPSVFKQVALPTVNAFIACCPDPFAIPVAINSNGAPSICGNMVSLPQLGAMITKAGIDKSPNTLHVLIGADANTIFDRIWPVLDVCKASGIACVGVAVSKGDQECMNTLPIFIPDVDPAAPNTASLTAAVINVQTNGFLIGNLINGRVIDLYRIEAAKASEQLFHLYLGHRLAVHDKSQHVYIVPSRGSSHAQVAEIIYWCWHRGLGKLSLVPQDRMPTIDSNAPAFHYED